MNKNNIGLFFLGLFIGCGLAAGGYFISQTHFIAKLALNTAEAKGLAERRVTADIANWQLVFRVSGKNKDDMPNLYSQAEDRQRAIITLLTENGFNEKEIQTGVINYYHKEFRDENQQLVDERHTLVGSIDVETKQVDLVSKVRASVNRLIADGIDIENKAPSYRFTRLNAIKPELLKEATRNARIAANEFADNAGVKVGRIRSARQGNFFIRDAGEQYGDTKKLEKDVRVVTTITFYLTDR